MGLLNPLGMSFVTQISLRNDEFCLVSQLPLRILSTRSQIFWTSQLNRSLDTSESWYGLPQYDSYLVITR